MAETTSAPAVSKVERSINTFNFINNSIEMFFDKNIQRFVKVDDSGDPEKDFVLQESNSLSKFEGEIIRILCKNKAFKYTYNLAKTMASNGRKNDNSDMIKRANDMRDKCLSYALSDSKIILTFKDVPKGTLEDYIDPLDGQKKQRASLRNKRQYTIEDIQIDDFGKQLLMQMLTK